MKKIKNVDKRLKRIVTNNLHGSCVKLYSHPTHYLMPFLR